MSKTIDAFELYPQAAWDLADSLSIVRSLSQKERDAIDSDDFAGPDHSFPIDTQAHLDAAAHLIGHAADPEAVKAKAIRIAKRKGFTLPKAWQEEEDGRIQSPLIIRADGSHDAFSGTHTHAHSAFGEQGGDEQHEHSHSHDGDSDHQHSHDEKKANIPDIVRRNSGVADLPDTAHLYVPIERIDKRKREVYGRATVEDVDAYRTIFSYEGSKKAFDKWMREFGNIREMHDDKRAIGKAVQVRFDDENKQVLVKARISRSLDGDNAWTKVEEGILNGFSVGASQGVWDKVERNGKEYPLLKEYNLVELSLVDHPATPGCTIEVVRNNGFVSPILEPEDEPEEVQTPPRNAAAEEERIGARVSADTRTSMHKARDHAAQGLRESAASCNCAECQNVLKCLDPDMDGDIDIIPGLDMDGDGAGGDGSGTGVMNAATAEIIRVEIARQMAPTILRMNGIAARFASTETPPVQPFDDTPITRRFDALEARLPELASSTELAEVRSLLSEVRELSMGVKSLTEQIAATPQQGGPIVNSAALRAAPAYVPTDPISEEAAVITRLAKAGILNKNQQINAALYLQNARQGQQSGR